MEPVLQNPTQEGASISTQRPCCFGYTPADEFIVVVYEQPTKETIYPITAHEVPQPKR